MIAFSIHLAEAEPSTLSGWIAVSLAVLSLGIYLWHLQSLSQVSGDTEKWQAQALRLEELRSEEAKERVILDFENRLLRLAAASADLDHLGGALLEQFTQAHEAGFAVLLQCHGNEFRFRRSIRLSEASQQRFWVEAELIRRASSNSPLWLSAGELVNCRWFRQLSDAEQRGVQGAWFIHWGEPGGRRLLWITTSLFPDDSERSKQAILHWTAMIGQQWLKTERWVTQQQQLQLTREMLELRSLTELNYPTPSELLHELLKRLLQMTRFDRAALYFSDAQKPAAVSQLPLVTTRWEEAETELLKEQHDLRETRIITCECGLDASSPFSVALMVPLGHEIVRLGTLSLTRESPEAVSDAQRELVEWGAGHLLETIARAVDRATIARRARRDGLTQLANRQTFDTEFVRLLDVCGRNGDECALILFDLDHFKQVNDHHGHQAGDAVLRCSAAAIESAVSQARATDVPLAARYGGEEFAVLLPNVGLAGARRIGEQIRWAVSESVGSTESATGLPTDLRVTVSGGIAIFPEHGLTAETLIGAADAALYQAKAAGRNQIHSA